jgi:hypothetical protein
MKSPITDPHLAKSAGPHPGFTSGPADLFSFYTFTPSITLNGESVGTIWVSANPESS